MQPARPAFAPLVLALALVLGACEERTPAAKEPPGSPATERGDLFASMDRAELTAAPAAPAALGEARTDAFDFDASAPERIWYGRATERELEHGSLGDAAAVEQGAGRAGAGLRLGPGLADTSRALLVVPAVGLARVRVAGRVRLDGNPSAGEASSREVLRVVEHERSLDDPTRLSRGGRRSSLEHRVSRRLDPSGWDTFETVFVARSSTSALELQLLHRSGGSEEAVTRFDDLVIEQQPLGEDEAWAHLRERYRPTDGREGATPWRLRVELPSSDGAHDEVRDAVLLPPGARLAIPATIPAKMPANSPAGDGPVLRFAYGMAPEAHGAPGDGARLAVAFRPADGDAEIPLGAVDFDPKNERDHRSWLTARIDLGPVAGRSGTLVFASSDAPGTEPDALDAVLLATPRVELAGAAPKRPNLLLVGVDTLRPDRTSAFGYGRDTTPHLAALADAGVRFPAARAQAPWTLPSFSSILTSLYPSVHGAGRGGHDEWTPIDPSTTSIAEVLAEQGYETHGLVANGLISPRYGLDQGFEVYRSAWGMESASEDAERVASWIEEHRSTPWLFFWHIMDPHLPYTTADEHRTAFTDASYDGRFARGRRGPEVPFQVLDPRPGRRWYTHEGPPPPPELDEADARFVSDYYDAEIAEMDAALGRVLDALRASGQWERTVVAFVADHGEGLGEHGHYHHGYTLFDDQVRIPLIVRVPGRFEGRVVERPVASIDLAPTVLSALGVLAPERFQGVDRLAPDAPADDAYVIEYPSYDSSAEKAWVAGDFKYVHDPVFRTEALYDVGADPAESRDVAADHPDVVRRARADLDAFRWEMLQKGRFHVRVAGKPGQELALSIRTDDLFDANFAARPAPPETAFELDLGRTTLALETVLERERLELVFWCRGRVLDVTATLDGEPLALRVGPDGAARETPASLERDSVPRADGADLPWPPPGTTLLWLESGVAPVAPVLLAPDEIDTLRELGYTR